MTGSIKACLTCGKDIYVTPFYEKRGYGKFCDRYCYAKWKSKNFNGSRNTHWKGGMKSKICNICGNTFSTYDCKNQKFCSRKCKGIYDLYHIKNKDTKIEKAVEHELNLRGITYHKQLPIIAARTVPDFIILPNIVVYCDGDYWHSLTSAKIRDMQQVSDLRRLGYNVYRFTESEIKNSVKSCVDRIKL